LLTSNFPRDERGGSAGKDDRRENGRDEKDVIPPMKKFEEPKAPVKF